MSPTTYYPPIAPIRTLYYITVLNKGIYLKKTICLILALLIFTTPILALESPCEDETYLELKKKQLDEMSEREYQYFTTKDTTCEQWKLNQQDLSKTVVLAEAETIKAETEAEAKKQIVYVIVGVSGIVTAILFIGIFY